MTIKEIKELRVQQEEISKSNSEETRQALKQLDELEKKAHDDLVKKIAKHFKGIKPTIVLNSSGIIILLYKKEFLGYKQGSFTWNNSITSKLAHTIKTEYEEVYGEPKEQTYTKNFFPTNASLKEQGWVEVNGALFPQYTNR